MISIASESSFYRPCNVEILGQNLESWMHPFVAGPSIAVAESPRLAAQHFSEHKNQYCYNRNSQILARRLNTYPQKLRTAIDHYLVSQLHRDTPMYELFKKNPELNNFHLELTSA